MLQKVGKFINKELKLAPKSKLILGVSGGVDSVVMLHILNKLKFDCVVAHCNFHLRGEESDRDENLVKNLAEKFQLPFEKVDFDTKKYAAENKISIEMAARDLRYSWFEEIRQKHRAEFIAVAHHADDSVETLLINLIRGTGLRGLKGIEPVNGKIIRPLLNCTRDEIEKYAEENQLDYIFDSSNADTDVVRNKIRLEILPTLAEINPSIKQTLTETTERLQGTWKIFEQALEQIKSEITFEKNNQFFIDIEKLKLQVDIKTVLFEILQSYQFHSDIINQIIDNLNNTSGLRFHSADYLLIKDREYLILSQKAKTENSSFEILENTSQLLAPFSLKINRISRNSDFVVSKSFDKIHLDLDKIQFPLTLRKWRAGDVFYPFGMRNSKKLSDFLIDEKVNLIDKQNTWVLTSNDKIMWIVGMRVDNRFAITNKTEKILEIKLLKD